MLMQEPTEEMIKEWKDIYNIYKDKLIPNKKDGLEIVKYLKNKYSVIEIKCENTKLKNIVYDNIVLNEYSKNKLDGKKSDNKTF